MILLSFYFRKEVDSTLIPDSDGCTSTLVMPTKHLPSNANIDHLKYQARDLLTAHAALDPQVAQRIREFHPRLDKATDAVIFGAKLMLSDAQLVIAREYGFPSWVRLRKHIEKSTLADNLNVPHHERS